MSIASLRIIKKRSKLAVAGSTCKKCALMVPYGTVPFMYGAYQVPTRYKASKRYLAVTYQVPTRYHTSKFLNILNPEF